MIISASRRTDIPSCHFDWFMDCLNTGYADVPNPRSPKTLRRVDLRPEAVDAFVFWTKNPLPMESAVMDPKSLLNLYLYYFQFTLTPYGKDVERFLPDKNELISAFQRFSKVLGARRMVWRYDPILISPDYSVSFHTDHFEKYTAQLQGYTDTCVISFLDEYRFLQKALKKIGGRAPDEAEVFELAEKMSAIAGKYGLRVQTCSETVDLSGFGIKPGACIDADLTERLVLERKPELSRQGRQAGKQISMFPEEETPMFPRAKGLRGACLCAGSIDIGKYDTCSNGCIYCYANHRVIL